MAFQQPALFPLFFMIICPLFLILLFLSYVYYEGMPFESIYKHKTTHITPWQELLPIASKFWAIVIPSGLLLGFIRLKYFEQRSSNEILLSMIIGVVFCLIYMVLLTFGARKEWIKIRISPDILIIHYLDLRKATRVRQFFNLKIYIKDIENIERVYFPDFFTDVMDNKPRLNRQLDGTYNYVITCSHESAVDGIDITLVNGKHIAFETDDAENCIRVLKNVSGLH